MIKIALAKVLTLKAAAVLAAVSAGGVAVAATTGMIPNPLSQNSPGPAHSTPAGDRPEGAGTPSPSLDGLCKAFRAGAGAEHGKALENPAFTVLITAAGGEDKVDAYCTTLLGAPPERAPADHPTGAPTPHPTGASGDRSTGPRESHEPKAPATTPTTPGS